MDLETEDDRVRGCEKGVLGNREQRVASGNLGGEGAAVGDDGGIVVA